MFVKGVLVPVMISPLFLLSFCLMSCVNPIEEVDQNASEKIINGNAESGHSYVVSLVGSNGTSECTGTLIAPKVVLTAAHCIISDYGIHPPSTIEVGSTVGASSNAKISVTSYLIREGWQMRTGGFDYNFDIALLYLDRDAPVRAAAYSRTNPSDVINQTILAVGYGNNNGFQNTGGGIKRSVNLTITESYQFHFIATWRDGIPLDTCQGDSGGPALFLGSRGMEVLGVVSNGPTFCQGSTQYTSVASHAFWIDQNLSSSSNATANPWGSSYGGDTSGGSNNTIYSTCSGFKSCIEECQANSQDQASYGQCVNECEGQSSQTAMTHYGELVNCIRQFSCQNNPSCQASYCSDQMSVCGVEVQQSPEGGGSNLPAISSCTELDQCARQCQQSYEGDRSSINACSMVCYSRANNDSIGKLNQLESCLARLSPTCVDHACVERECRDEIVACGYQLSNDAANTNTNTGASSGGVGGGNSNCTDIYSCMAGCSAGDDFCVQSCVEQGSDTARGQISALIDCYYGNSCENFFDYQCMADQCPSEFGACIR